MLLSELPFEPVGDNLPGPATGISIAGVDLANLYAPASAGVASGVVTGFTVAGVDIGLSFAGAGTTARLNNSWADTYSEFEIGSLSVGATVMLEFKQDGTVTTPYGELRWLAPNLVGADYEILAETVSGTFSTNEMAAFAQLNTDRELSLFATVGPGIGFVERTAVAKITIRKIAEPTTLVVGSVTMIVNVESYGSGPPP